MSVQRVVNDGSHKDSVEQIEACIQRLIKAPEVQDRLNSLQAYVLEKATETDFASIVLGARALPSDQIDPGPNPHPKDEATIDG